MEKMKLYTMVLGAGRTNCYVIANAETKEAFVVDPADRGESIREKLARESLTLKGVLLTHGHFDHILGLEALLDGAPIPVYAAGAEEALLADPNVNLSASMRRSTAVKPIVPVVDGQTLALSELTLRVILTPGHTAGSCCYYCEAEGVLFSGDTLFAESVGRTDLPTGEESCLKASIDSLYQLPDAVKVFSGHGPQTTIGHEKAYNPFMPADEVRG